MKGEGATLTPPRNVRGEVVAQSIVTRGHMVEVPLSKVFLSPAASVSQSQRVVPCRKVAPRMTSLYCIQASLPEGTLGSGYMFDN